MIFKIKKMKDQKRYKFKSFLVVIGLAVLLGGVALTSKFLVTDKNVEIAHKDEGEKKLDRRPAVQGKVEAKDVSKKEIPGKLPKDMPSENGTRVIQNYTATSDDGRIQSTRSYESGKSLDENKKLFTSYFSKNSWEVVASSDEEDIRAMTAVKNNLLMQVTINKNTENKLITVETSLIETPAKTNNN